MKKFIILTFISIFYFGCYRETALPLSPIVGTQITTDNIETMPSGVEATGIVGDYTLFNNYVQLVVQGNTWSPNYCLYEPLSGGAIVDLATRTTGYSQEQISKNDDGIHLIRQGVNLSSQTVIGYHSIHVTQKDRDMAYLTMEGKVFDLDGSLSQSGAAVSPADHSLQGVHVQTEISLTPSRDIENNDNAAVNFFKITTVISNTSQLNVPIYTVHDSVLLQKNTYDSFIPYPDWGFEKPREGERTSVTGDAYPPYVLFQSRQENSANMFFTSQLDGLFSANRESEMDSDRIMVGKFYTSQAGLAPGEQLTYIRELHAYVSSTPPQALYARMVNYYQESLKEDSIYKQTGTLGFVYNANASPGGEFIAEHISPEIQWFDGKSFQPVSPEKPFPVWGSRKLSSSFTFEVPIGQYQLQAQAFQSNPVTFSYRERTDINEDGEEIVVEEPFYVKEDKFFNMGALDIGEHHASIAVSGEDDSGSRRLYRFTTQPTDGGNLPIVGPSPSGAGGNTLYPSEFVTQLFLPQGTFDIYISHGPLFYVNTVPTTVSEISEINEYGETQTSFSSSESTIKANLRPAIDLQGYFSADFGIATAYHERGLNNPVNVTAFAEAEDLDVVFFVDTNKISQTKTFLAGKSSILGSFVKKDDDDDNIKLDDIITPAFAYCTRGVPTETYPYGKGSFAVLGILEDDISSNPPQLWGDPADFYDQVKSTFPDSLIMVQNPRGPLESQRAFFSAIAAMLGLNANETLPVDNTYFSRLSGSGSSTTWLDFDLIQILDGNDYQGYLQTRADWFNLLNAGIYKPITGGSSVGSTANLCVGAVRTFVAVTPGSEHKDYDMTEFWNSTRQGNMFVTNGPIIEASIGGATYGETTQGSSSLELKIQAAAWIPVQSARIYVDGVLAQKLQLDASQQVRFEGTIPLELSAGSHWVVVEAGTELETYIPGTPAGTFSTVYRNHTPIAITNPIFVNVN
ncbi:MAG: hypothetical protein CR997_09000 [Acidobacteria bacterium]|nr:MAG: hypothetical protein CR997_09000 [Acidobacteriota bacterium]